MNLLERAYLLGLSIRQRSALKHRKKLPCRVISIGNITTGGTGKTPATIALAQEAKRRGMRPVILTRGYRGSAPGPCFVSRGERPLLTHIQAGDEPVLMAEKLSGTEIVKGADRHASGMFAIAELGLACPRKDARPGPLFLLDDGFQHWRLHRDRDVVLVDALDPFSGGRLLPLGRLREPLSALGRADVIAVTRCDADGPQESVISTIRRHNRAAPVFRAWHRVAAVRSPDGTRFGPARLAGMKVFGACGLGNPAGFQETIRTLQAELTGLRTYRDHYPYNQADVAAVTREAAALGADAVVTTEKDYVRMAGLDLPENLLIIEIEFAAEDGFFDAVLNP
ncbi:MAG: tetraacyldisaccharide 4'-kinase [Thermodesulfovibrionales bacterium]